MNDRIKLAMAMGWERISGPDKQDDRFFPPNNYKRSASTPDWFHALGLPDPFTDANKDYAVLEWLREEFCKNLADDSKDGEAWKIREAVADQIWRSEYDEPLPNSAKLTAAMGYKIGDYARAALKVINE